MSRGLGKTQKQLIELGGATELLFDCVHSLTVCSGSRTAVPDFKPGKGLDGIERWYGTQTVTTAEYLKELIAERDILYANAGDQYWFQKPHDCEKVAKATIYADDIKVKADSYLYGQKRELFSPRPIVSEKDKKAKNKMRVTLHRAFSSMEKRGLIVALGGNPFGVPDDSKIFGYDNGIHDRRGWEEVNGTRNWRRGRGQFYLVIDPAALASSAVKQPA